MRIEYSIVDDFQAGKMRVLVLDAAYEYGKFNRVVIEGREYSFSLNSVSNWVAIESTEKFKGKSAKFIHCGETRD